MTYGDDANKVAYSYDNLGRTAAKTLTVGGRAYETGYSYLPGSNGSGNTTALISVLSQPGEAFSYTYDDVGNISSVTRNGMTTTYVYDKLGQLIQVNDPEDTADGTTWVYEYDLGGNILCKKRYAYTTGELGSVLETIAYEYDTVWKDKLVKYDGNAITYDAIGNPLTDGTWTYTWEKGRQLKQMTKPGTTATFAYNADGLRIRKTVNGVDTNYTLHGKNIVHMTQGANDLHFWYDAQNRPAIVQFNGEKYGYVVNLQGDVVSLIDNTGTEVVKYVYDAWGKILSTTGSLASTLGTIQPFRYRGYVFDQETELYYLKNRYYSHTYHRFINEDSIFDSKNMFCYCLNNPINNIDKNGTNTVKIIYYIDTAADILKFVGVLHDKKPTTKVGRGAYDEEEVVYIYIPNEQLSPFIEYLYFEDIDFTNPHNTSSDAKDALLFAGGVALDMASAPPVIGYALDILSGLKDRRSAQTETEFRKDLLASRQKSEKTQAGVVIKVTHKNTARMRWHQPSFSTRTMPCHSLEFDTYEFTEFSQSEEGKRHVAITISVPIN